MFVCVCVSLFCDSTAKYARPNNIEQHLCLRIDLPFSFSSTTGDGWHFKSSFRTFLRNTTLPNPIAQLPFSRLNLYGAKPRMYFFVTVIPSTFGGHLACAELRIFVGSQTGTAIHAGTPPNGNPHFDCPPVLGLFTGVYYSPYYYSYCHYLYSCPKP